MNIQKAVRKARLASAKGKQGYIVRKKWKGNFRILPTNTDLCSIADAPGMEQAPRWNPYAEDLMADDWEVQEVRICTQ